MGSSVTEPVIWVLLGDMYVLLETVGWALDSTLQALIIFGHGNKSA